MVLVSDEVEFRRVNSSVGKSGKTNYYYTFEDGNGSFQLFSRNDLSAKLEKGENVRLIFNGRLWDNKMQYDLVDVQ